MRLSKELISAGAAASLLLIQIPGALAAKKAPRKAKPEVYSAVEPGMVTITTTVPVGSAAITEETSEKQTPPAADSYEEEQETTALPTPPAPVVETPKALAHTFDPVPSDQAGLIAKRLPLIEKLLVKHGRAYDYRSHTVKQLEALLAELDKAEKN